MPFALTRPTAMSTRVVLPLAALLCWTACSADRARPCGPFPDWSTSPYVLPYPAGTSWKVNQANCSGYGHSGFWQFGYDFIMPIGSVVTAARAGTVGWSVGRCEDGDSSCTNLVTIIHVEGDVTLYSHLTRNGALVRPGVSVRAGDTIGLSGNTGWTGGLPHLHFSRHPCNQLPGLPGAPECPTRPLTFSNADPNPNGLRPQRSYRAH